MNAQRTTDPHNGSTFKPCDACDFPRGTQVYLTAEVDAEIARLRQEVRALNRELNTIKTRAESALFALNDAVRAADETPACYYWLCECGQQNVDFDKMCGNCERSPPSAAAKTDAQHCCALCKEGVADRSWPICNACLEHHESVPEKT